MNPRQLATEINRWLDGRNLSGKRIDVTAPYSWVRHGYKPYAPIPSVAAAVLSEKLGSPITVDELWPAHRTTAPSSLTAANELGSFETMDAPLAALDELAASSAGSNTDVTPANGADLAAAVHQGLHTTLRWTTPGTLHREHVLQPQVDVIAAHVTALRKLDDRHGGGALSLRYITGNSGPSSTSSARPTTSRPSAGNS
ncbi:hypothetical protein [Actinomadura sp. CNU-125]|uniref:hypothetical protein n=1 Tax=Actinomadura sp. CNU-125 TaxID=1904961 RepID=UPI001177A206|nr:hypothetical protein [Actinomadura sp. CNU-125]